MILQNYWGENLKNYYIVLDLLFVEKGVFTIMAYPSYTYALTQRVWIVDSKWARFWAGLERAHYIPQPNRGSRLAQAQDRSYLGTWPSP